MLKQSHSLHTKWSVANLVMMYANAKDIWAKLINTFEQNSIPKLNLLMIQFFHFWKDPNDNVATHAAEQSWVDLYRNEQPI